MIASRHTEGGDRSIYITRGRGSEYSAKECAREKYSAKGVQKSTFSVAGISEGVGVAEAKREIGRTRGVQMRMGAAVARGQKEQENREVSQQEPGKGLGGRRK